MVKDKATLKNARATFFFEAMQGGQHFAVRFWKNLFGGCSKVAGGGLWP